MRETDFQGQPSERGFTVVEILVALFVLSVGLLGLASLQMIGVKNSGSAYHRTQATLIANELIEKMRGNKLGAREGRYVTTADRVDAVDCNGQAPTELVSNQSFHSLCAVKRSLPRGTLTVTCLEGCGVAPPTSVALKYEVKVTWIELERDHTQSQAPAADPIPKVITLEVVL